MCGIVGIASRDCLIDPPVLTRMRDTLRHRGPDDAGIWQSPDGYTALAHRRLSIVDLSAAAHQPMIDEASQLAIVFNGEIYNHRELRRSMQCDGMRFRSASDTEVILAAYRTWETGCLTRLNGMFALALYDGGKRHLLLARDRAGEKPLFYWHEHGKLLFASELKALMCLPEFPRRLDPEGLDFYLAYGYVPGERCILQGVRKLAPGQALVYEVEDDRLRTWRYWTLPEPQSPPRASNEDLAKELESLLEDSVRRQLVADVPVGILLSGGIDSSLVTAMAARACTKRVKTFTISFPGHGAYDESAQARIVAEHFGTEHTELAAEPATASLLPDLARQYDEPIADSSMVPTFLVSRLIRRHATVALGGDGGDELFGGYPHYCWIQRQERVRQRVCKALRHPIGEAAARFLPPGFRGRNYLVGFSADLPYSIAHVNVYFDRWTRRRLLSRALRRLIRIPGPEEYRAALCDASRSVLRQATEADFRTTMADAYLVKVDRASMLNSLEVRAPWLDYHLIEFAFGRVPDCGRATVRERKILPRVLARRILPPTLDTERKQGFSIPLASWFKGEWGAYMQGVLRDADPDLFDRKVIQEMIRGQRRGFSNTARLFSLTIFELWRREYRISPPS